MNFGHLLPEVMVRVVDKFVGEVESQLAERRIAIELQPAARDWLAEKGYQPDFGARPLTRVIQKELKDPLTDEVLFGRLAKGGRVVVDVQPGGERLSFDFPDSPDAPDASAESAEEPPERTPALS